MNILKDHVETACYKRENSVSFLYDIDAFFHQLNHDNWLLVIGWLYFFNTNEIKNEYTSIFTEFRAS